MKQTVQLTAEGKVALEQELQELIANRPALAEHIAITRDFGDLKENEEYSAARNEQKMAENRILEIQEILKSAEVIQIKTANIIKLGTTVVVKANDKESTYSLVGPIEADPLAGRLSNESPLGKALIGRKVGETAELTTPKGTTVYTIVSIS